MKPVKKKNGQWRVTIYDYKDAAGKVHQKTFTADTRQEVLRMAAAYKNGSKMPDLSVGEVVKGYIDSKKAVLSPSTHRAYMSIYRMHFESSRLGSVRVSDLNNVLVQQFVSGLDLKPKTVRNISGLLTSAVSMYCPEKTFSITLPAKIRPQLHTPTTDEVNQIIAAISGDHDLYIAALLCAFGPMRRSEACAVRYDDIDRKACTITVRRACVKNSDHEWIYKDFPKNESSYRTIQYPRSVIKKIGRGFGYLISDTTPDMISRKFDRARDRLELPRFRFHDLRHYSASILHAIGIPDQYIMARGGWKTDHVMKRVYRDTISDVEREMNDKINDFFGQSLAK